MRIKSDQIVFLKHKVESILRDASVFIFGSRASDELKGGDIDLLILGERTLDNQEKRDIRIAFHKRFGEQKIDIVSFKRDDVSTFKDLALLEAVQI